MLKQSLIKQNGNKSTSLGNLQTNLGIWYMAGEIIYGWHTEQEWKQMWKASFPSHKGAGMTKPSQAFTSLILSYQWTHQTQTPGTWFTSTRLVSREPWASIGITLPENCTVVHMGKSSHSQTIILSHCCNKSIPASIIYEQLSTYCTRLVNYFIISHSNTVSAVMRCIHSDEARVMGTGLAMLKWYSNN